MAFADSLLRRQRDERLQRALAIAVKRGHLPGYGLTLNLQQLRLLEQSLQLTEVVVRHFGMTNYDMAGLRAIEGELFDLREMAIDDLLSLDPSQS